MAGFPPTRSWIALALADRGEEVERFFDTASDAARHRNINAVAANFGTRAFCRILDGDLAQAQSDAERALELVLPVGLEMFTAVWRVALVWALAERGELDVAKRIVDRDIREELLGPGLVGGVCACVRGHVHAEIGDHEASRRDFLAAGERVAWLPYANPEGIGWRTGLATAEAALGNAERAGEMAGEAVDLAREAGGRRGIGVALRVQGAVAGTEGVEVLREAVEILAGTRARLQHARALVDLGAARRRANRRKEAREPLREGLDLAHRCGAAALEERARTELAATGARPRSVVLSGVDALTPSELRVAGMAAEGMTNREIAQQLYVTAKTVETHLRHAYQKLDVARRAELAAALQQG
jgi:DNA-binding CsgD family transcriptional regulator